MVTPICCHGLSDLDVKARSAVGSDVPISWSVLNRENMTYHISINIKQSPKIGVIQHEQAIWHWKPNHQIQWWVGYTFGRSNGIDVSPYPNTIKTSETPWKRAPAASVEKKALLRPTPGSEQRQHYINVNNQRKQVAQASADDEWRHQYIFQSAGRLQLPGFLLGRGVLVESFGELPAAAGRVGEYQLQRVHPVTAGRHLLCCHLPTHLANRHIWRHRAIPHRWRPHPAKLVPNTFSEFG